MRSVPLVLVVFVLLSYVPPVRSGLNIYIRQIFDSCWMFKGVCKEKCDIDKEETYHILCGTQFLCCIHHKDKPILFEK
ncbi:beta-defensin 30-like [Peromyscus leucopus]|uniref:beta-defensin 30-like n=1 Tax=Peromyscus leucopus TaxID=10041 RepID=UPI0010A0CC83|nr:beta-defensin 30-like [Peromyscus leucopus]XP_028740017.1 beta-defensin 30-like [Peromyscus leucopus]